LKRYVEARKAFEQASALGIADARRALEVLDKEGTAAQGVSETSKPSAQSAMSAEQRQAKIDADVNLIADALEAYKKEHGAYPTDPQGLQALLTIRASGSDQGKAYISALPKTPWGRDYLYKTTGVWLIYRERSQPVGVGWKWSETNRQWERTDNGYVLQIWEPDGTSSSMPKKQFGPLPPGVYFAPAGGIR
jgi:type II secretory pathway pseudopilin PulG